MLSSVLFAILLIGFSYLVTKKHLRNRKLPPGPKFLPALNLITSKYPHLEFNKQAEKYGPIFTCPFGKDIAIIVSSHEIIKALFKREEASARYVPPVIADRGHSNNLGIIWGNGQSWNELRSYTAKNLRDYGFGKKKSLKKSLDDEAYEFVMSLKSEVQRNNGMLKFEGREFEVFAINTIWGSVGGFRFDTHDEKFQKALSFGDKIITFLGHDNLSNILPFLRNWFPDLSGHTEQMEVFKNYSKFLEEIMLEAARKQTEEYEEVNETYIQKFLNKIRKHSDGSSPYYTMEQLTIVLSDLFLAGTETLNNTLLFSIVYMTLNPSTQDQGRKAIFEKIPNANANCTLEELRKVPYLKALVLETFRKCCFLPSPVPRVITQDIYYEEYLLPKGSILLYNLHPVFNDKCIWGDPEVFRPERFLDSNGQLIREKEELISIFGLGKRICLGEAIAWDVLLTFVAALLLHFRFEAIPGNEPTDEQPRPGITTKPRAFTVKVHSL